MSTNPIYVDTQEEILEVVERLRNIPGDRATLIVPARARLGQSRLNFQLLNRYAQQMGRKLYVVSPETSIQQMAAEAGLHVEGLTTEAGLPMMAPAVPPAPPLSGTLATEPLGSPPSWAPAVPEPDTMPTPVLGVPVVPYPPAPVAPLPQPEQAPAAAPGPIPAVPSIAVPPAPGPSWGSGGVAPAAVAAGSVIEPGSYRPADPELAFDTPIPSSTRPGRGVPRPPMGRTNAQTGGSDRDWFERAPSMSGGRRKALYAGAALAVLASVAAVMLFVPSATITLVTQASPYTEAADLQAQPQQPPISVRTVTSSVQKANGTFTVTGQKDTPAAPAKGTVIYTNNNCRIQGGKADIVISDGQLLKAGPVSFTQLGDVTVLYGKTASVSVVAQSPGAAGNVPPGAINSIDGQPPGCLTVTNPNAASGGADERKDPQISQDDFDKAQGQLKQQLQDQIKADLQHQARTGERLSDQIDYEAPNFIPDHQVGDLVSSFSATMQLSGQGELYLDSDVKKALTDNLEKQAELQHPDQSLIPDQIQTDYSVTGTGQGGLITFHGTATGYLAPRLDDQQIRNRLAGHSVTSAREYLNGLPISSAQITQSSFHLPWMPFLASRIRLVYEIDQGH